MNAANPNILEVFKRLTEIRIRIHKFVETVSNADPDPLQNFRGQSWLKKFLKYKLKVKNISSL
jgi:hypothetical protein